ncbi:ABC transporter ATP-binding protein [Nocardia panacis]|uniref:ABC transporter ATP-binding protein n=1 Tax=Nocardia panacis TaxID=2340916 RepID=A0A3A4K1S4_9NOCA|nr:ABC transporter ATP-binding protein [Nocardia panacis]RJO70077.1 ABC transporter ATP-binding protein [Nocardia panacis]
MIRHLYRLWPNPRPLVQLIALHACLAILQGLLLGLLIPILRALLRPEPDLAAARPWLILGALGALIYAVLKVIASPVGFAASMKMAEQMRHHLMGHVTTLPLGWFTGESKARLARTVTTSAGNVAHLAATFGPPAISGVLTPLTVVCVTFVVDWRAALLLLVILPFAFLALRRAGRIQKEADHELEQNAVEIASRAIEFGQAQPVLRAAGHGVTGGARMRAALDEHRLSYRRGLRRSLFPDLTYTGVVMLGFAAALVLGATFLLGGELAVADIVALLVLAVRFLEPLGTLTELLGTLHAMDNAVARVEAVLNTPALPRSAHPVREIRDATIEFEDVTYSYGDTAALSRVSFTCRPGTTTALIGPSGSGKTTVTRLVARFFDVDSGSVRVGGVDVRDLDQAALLGEIAIVFQDVYLFDTTIEENLRIARPEATAAELREAARAARLDEVVARLPEGWATRVGEGGAQLSGGERQRVSIARAFLKHARIVLLDEAGSALDPENENAIGAAIANLGRDPERTLIVIAHRPATLATADHVVTLDSGAVSEIDTPAQLRAAGGIFARLYTQYEHARNWHITTTA